MKSFLLSIKSEYKKKAFMLLIIVSVLIIFHEPIENLISKFLVQPIFQYVQASYINDSVFIILLTVALLNVYVKFKTYTPSENDTIFLYICGAFYLFYRISQEPWELTHMKLIDSIFYMDFILVLIIFQSSYYFKKNKKINHRSHNLFLDSPINSQDDDIFNYQHYARLLEQKIKNNEIENSFAIGINGPWGSGKTSLMNLIRKRIADSEFVIIDFDSWNYKSSEGIIKGFFEKLYEGLRPYHSDASKLINEYSNKLVKNNSTISWVSSLSQLIASKESAQNLFDQIKGILSKLGIKIVVFVDDLDRLNTDEIIEVIRLIRNTANFQNTYFLVAYDRNYIINSLSHNNTYKKEHFLEKIFQLEVSLPSIDKGVLTSELVNRLKDKLSVSLHNQIDHELKGGGLETPIINNWIYNLRDVNRISNSIILNYSTLIGEVRFRDLLMLELLRVKYPSVYWLLYNERKLFFDFERRQGERDEILKLKKTVASENELKVHNKDSETHLERYIRENNDDLSVPKKDIDKIIKLIRKLFQGDHAYYSPKALSVSRSSKFQRYFSYSLNSKELSEIEFIGVMKLELEEVKSKIDDWIDKGMQIEVVWRFMEIDSYSNQIEFEKVIGSIFYLAQKEVNESSFYGRKTIEYEYEDLKRKLLDYDNRISNKLYGGLNGKDKLREFLVKLFKDANKPYLFTSNLISHVLNDYSESFPISMDELRTIGIEYLNDYCSSVEKFDSNIWNLFNGCYYSVFEELGGGRLKRERILDDRVIPIIKDFLFKKDLIGFLTSVLTTHQGKNEKFALSNVVLNIFDSWKGFESFLKEYQRELKEASGSGNEVLKDQLIEFICFFKLFEDSGYTKYVDYTFTKIKSIKI